VLRCPILRGINDDREHFQAIAALNERYPHLYGIELLPYHDTGLYKLRLLGMDSPDLSTAVPSDDDRLQYRQFLAGLGVRISN